MKYQFWYPVLLVFTGGAVIIEAQNCGFPLAPLKVKPIREDTSVGTIVEKLRILNIEDQTGQTACTGSRSNEAFISWIGSKSEKQLQITLLANVETLIDENKLQDCLVDIKLRCTDGRWKVLKLQFPLHDTNSKVPTFVRNLLKLQIDLPWWNCDVPLNFEPSQAIEVKDSDRDLKNAEISFTQSSNQDVFKFYLEDSSHYLDENLTHTFRLKIKLVDCNTTAIFIRNRNMKYVTSIEIHNVEPPCTPDVSRNSNQELTIEINFGLSKTAIENLVSPDYFDVNLYNLTLELSDWDGNSKRFTGVVFKAFPPFIVALVDKIKYAIADDMGRFLFSVDAESGQLLYNNKPTLEYVKSLTNHVGIYTINAWTETWVGEEQYKALNSIIHLLVYFDIDDVADVTDIYDKGTTNFENEITEYTSKITSNPTEIASSDVTHSHTSSTPSLPEQFKCHEAGWFVDTEYCNVFHVCEETGYGLRDSRFCCAQAFRARYWGTMLISCERSRSCEFEIFSRCTCSTKNYDGNCFP